MTFYPRMLLQQFGVGASLLFALGLVVAAWRRQWLMLGTLLGPFFVLSVLIQNKNLRYSLPLLGVMAVIAALALTTLPRGVRRGAAVALLLLGALQVAAIAAGVPPNVRLPGARVWWVPASPPMRSGLAARARSWRCWSGTAAARRRRSASFPMTTSSPSATSATTRVRDRLDLRFVRAWDDPPLGIDYMILKTGNVGPQWTAEKAIRVSERLARDPALARVFPVIGEFPLPDGSTATVRARRVPAGGRGARRRSRPRSRRALRRRLGDVVRDVEGLRDPTVAYDDAIRAGRIAPGRDPDGGGDVR